MKIFRLIISIILADCMIACSSTVNNSPDYINAEQSSFVWEAPINSIGNTNNGGNFFFVNDTLYGRLVPNPCGTGFFCLGKKVDDQVDVLFDESDASNIVEYQGYLYFIDSADNILYDLGDEPGNYYNGNIRKLDLSRGKSEIIVNSPVFCFYIYKDKIYYQVSTRKGNHFTTTVNRADLDGKNKKIIYENSSGDFFTCPFSVYDDTLYFASNDAGIVRVPLHGDELGEKEELHTKFSEISRIITMVPFENGVFFSGITDEPFDPIPKLYRFDFESQQLTLILDERLLGFTMDNDSLYCSTEKGVYQVEIESMKKTLLFDDLFGKPEIVNHTLYFFVQHNHGAATEFECRALA